MLIRAGKSDASNSMSSNEVHPDVKVIGMTLIYNNQIFSLSSKILVEDLPQEEKFLTYQA